MKKPFVISACTDNDDPNNKYLKRIEYRLYYANSTSEAKTFAADYFATALIDAYAEEVDNYKASVVLKLKKVK